MDYKEVQRIVILTQTPRWTKSHGLLTELGIKKDDITQMVEGAPIALRYYMMPMRIFIYVSFGNLLSFRWTKGNELITELNLKQNQIPEIVKDAHIALRYTTMQYAQCSMHSAICTK